MGDFFHLSYSIINSFVFNPWEFNKLLLMLFSIFADRLYSRSIYLSNDPMTRGQNSNRNFLLLMKFGTITISKSEWNKVQWQMKKHTDLWSSSSSSSVITWLFGYYECTENQKFFLTEYHHHDKTFLNRMNK